MDRTAKVFCDRPLYNLKVKNPACKQAYTAVPVWWRKWKHIIQLSYFYDSFAVLRTSGKIIYFVQHCSIICDVSCWSTFILTLVFILGIPSKLAKVHNLLWQMDSSEAVNHKPYCSNNDTVFNIPSWLLPSDLRKWY